MLKTFLLTTFALVLIVGCAGKEQTQKQSIYSDEFLFSRFYEGYSKLNYSKNCEQAMPYFKAGMDQNQFFDLSMLYYDYCVGRTGSVHSFFQSSIYTGSQRGSGVTADEYKWILLHAEEGGVVESFALGQMQLNGYLVPKNHENALTMMAVSAKAGYGHAQMQLALALLETGDDSNGLKWLEKAAESNYPGAKEMLDGFSAILGIESTQTTLSTFVF